MSFLEWIVLKICRKFVFFCCKKFVSDSSLLTVWNVELSYKWLYVWKCQARFSKNYTFYWVIISVCYLWRRFFLKTHVFLAGRQIMRPSEKKFNECARVSYSGSPLSSASKTIIALFVALIILGPTGWPFVKASLKNVGHFVHPYLN